MGSEKVFFFKIQWFTVLGSESIRIYLFSNHFPSRKFILVYKLYDSSNQIINGFDVKMSKL